MWAHSPPLSPPLAHTMNAYSSENCISIILRHILFLRLIWHSFCFNTTTDFRSLSHHNRRLTTSSVHSSYSIYIFYIIRCMLCVVLLFSKCSKELRITRLLCEEPGVFVKICEWFFCVCDSFEMKCDVLFYFNRFGASFCWWVHKQTPDCFELRTDSFSVALGSFIRNWLCWFQCKHISNGMKTPIGVIYLYTKYFS